MLRLMRFGVYFEKKMKVEWLFLYKNNYGIVTRIYALGAWGPAYVTRKFLEIMMQFVAFWCISDCVLKNSLKINIFWIKK